MVVNSSANAGDMGLVPGPGNSMCLRLTPGEHPSMDDLSAVGDTYSISLAQEIVSKLSCFISIKEPSCQFRRCKRLQRLFTLEPVSTTRAASARRSPHVATRE